MTLNLSAFFEKHIISIISDHKSAIQNERRTRQRLSYRNRLHNGGNSPRNSPSPRYRATFIIKLQSKQIGFFILFCWLEQTGIFVLYKQRRSQLTPPKKEFRFLKPSGNLVFYVAINDF